MNTYRFLYLSGTIRDFRPTYEIIHKYTCMHLEVLNDKCCNLISLVRLISPEFLQIATNILRYQHIYQKFRKKIVTFTKSIFYLHVEKNSQTSFKQRSTVPWSHNMIILSLLRRQRPLRISQPGNTNKYLRFSKYYTDCLHDDTGSMMVNIAAR